MKKIIKTVISSALLLGVGASAYADYRPYGDIGVGYAAAVDMPDGNSYNDLPGVVPTGESSSSATNYGGRVAIGVLWDVETKFSYGVEAAGAYYGVTKYSNPTSSVEMNYYGLELLGVAQWNMDKLHLIAKAGATDEQLHPTKNNIDNNEQLQDSEQVLPEVGAGFSYSFTPNVQLGLMYYHTFGGNVSFDTTGDATTLPSVNMGLLELMVLF